MLKKIEYFFILLAVLAIGFFVANWAFKGAIHHKKEVIVPDVVGMPLIEALNTLSEQKLAIRSEGTEFDESKPAGTVLRQLPESGMTVREGKTIRVSLSQGGETTFVPDLVGQSLRSAEISLRYNLLSLGEIGTQPSLKYEKDMVMSQEPPAKSIIAKNSFVHLVVSNGPPTDGTLLMPDFVGRHWDKVVEWSKESGVTVIKQEEDSASDPQTVLEQDIPPDTRLFSRSKIRIVVASENSISPIDSETFGDSRIFRYDVPQSESAKRYRFVLVDPSGSREIWRGKPQPGTKLKIPIPKKLDGSARLRIYINSILTEERNLK